MTPDGAQNPRTLFMIAGEESGDAYGAGLAAALRAKEPGVRLRGLGGPRMAAAGVELFQDLASHAIMGVAGLPGNVAGLVRAYRTVTHRLSLDQPSGIVLIDFPEFNLAVARHANRVGVPVIDYVSPQVWAWRTGRVRKVAARVRKVLCLFEFEEEFYRRHGVAAEHVGHPLLDTMADKLAVTDHGAVREELGLPASGPLIGLLPGSRRKEVQHVFPLLLRAAEMIRRERDDATFVTGAAAGLGRGLFAEIGGRVNVPFRIVSGRAHDVMLASDVLLICSGTATLEAALLGTPMVVTYRANLVNYLLFGMLIRPGCYALPNIVAGERIVPELYMMDARPKRLAAAALELLDGRL
ncbi:MAG: lipid-A-disaccharide synthase, partial [bacterium]